METRTKKKDEQQLRNQELTKKEKEVRNQELRIYRYVLELFNKLFTSHTKDGIVKYGVGIEELEKWHNDSWKHCLEHKDARFKAIYPSNAPDICQDSIDKDETKNLIGKCKIIVSILQAAAKIPEEIRDKKKPSKKIPEKNLKLVIQAYSIWLIHCIGLYLQDFASLGEIKAQFISLNGEITQKGSAINKKEQNLVDILVTTMPKKNITQNNAGNDILLEDYMKLLILVYGGCIHLGLANSPSLADKKKETFNKAFKELKEKCLGASCRDEIYTEILKEFGRC